MLIPFLRMRPSPACLFRLEDVAKLLESAKLAEWASAYGLPDSLQRTLNNDDKAKWEDQLADAFTAYLGAVDLEFGFNIVENIIADLIKDPEPVAVQAPPKRAQNPRLPFKLPQFTG